MLEYIFFHEHPWRRFIVFAEELGLNPEARQGDEGWVVELPEDLDEALDERLEAFYDEMLDYNQDLVAETEGAEHVHLAGIDVTLGDGRRVQAGVDPKLMRRLLEAVSPEELGEFVNAIVDAVENPDERAFCQR